MEKEKKEWCGRCNREQGFGNFCVICGKELVKEPVCDCGEPLWGYYKFCPKCGKEKGL